MSNGIKISGTGQSVDDTISAPSADSAKVEKRILPHLLYSVALSYLQGAKTQVARYKDAVKIEHAVTKVQVCMHEASCLFEDLTTVAKYAQMCGDQNELHALWLDVRNHIRHDIREEMDNEDSKLKSGRAQRLGLNPKLQMEISFTDTSIKVGSTIIELTKIEAYISWAEGVIEKNIIEAIDNGFIKGMSYEK